MNEFKAATDRQLALCLRMLFSEKLQGHVRTMQNEQGKIEFRISVPVDEQRYAELKERYELLIS